MTSTLYNLKIVEAKSADEVLSLIGQSALVDATIFLDVDDTIIVPKSNSFREGYDFIDRMKEHSGDYDNFAEILSNWRLQRKTMLIDANWSKIVDKLKTNYSVYGLTKMDTGKFGNIVSMEKWRVQELEGLGIKFTQNEEAEKLRANTYKINSTFHNGILFTGDASKSETIKFFNHTLSIQSIIFVDDRLDHLQDVGIFCKNNDLGYLGIHFIGAKFVEGKYRPEIAEFQVKHLINNVEWLEDSDAEKLLKSFEGK